MNESGEEENEMIEKADQGQYQRYIRPREAQVSTDYDGKEMCQR